MKYSFLFLSFLTLSIVVQSQGIIGTPNSMYLVFNYPNNSFYIKIEGKDKIKLDNPYAFTIDGRFVQVLTIKTSKFLIDTTKQITDKEILLKYVNWEKDYLTSLYLTDIDCKVEALKTRSGRDYLFWTYDVPISGEDTITDTVRTYSVRKQLYVSTIVGQYVFGAYTPYMKSRESFSGLKKFIIRIIESITTSEKEIDLDELNRTVNK
jgi:hypothetical protein